MLCSPDTSPASKHAQCSLRNARGVNVCCNCDTRAEAHGGSDLSSACSSASRVMSYSLSDAWREGQGVTRHSHGWSRATRAPAAGRTELHAHAAPRKGRPLRFQSHKVQVSEGGSDGALPPTAMGCIDVLAEKGVGFGKES